MATKEKMKQVKQSTVDLVSGYIRSAISTMFVFPQELVDLCLIYYFITECFSTWSEGIVCENQNRTLSGDKGREYIW